MKRSCSLPCFYFFPFSPTLSRWVVLLPCAWPQCCWELGNLLWAFLLKYKRNTNCKMDDIFVFLFTRRMIQTTLSCLTRTLFFVMGFQVKVKGKIASLLEAPIFVAAPHSSFFDAIISALTGMPSIVSRAENLSTPVLGSKYLWKNKMLEVSNLTLGQKSYLWNWFKGRCLKPLGFKDTDRLFLVKSLWQVIFLNWSKCLKLCCFFSDMKYNITLNLLYTERMSSNCSG